MQSSDGEKVVLKSAGIIKKIVVLKSDFKKNYH